MVSIAFRVFLSISGVESVSASDALVQSLEALIPQDLVLHGHLEQSQRLLGVHEVGLSELKPCLKDHVKGLADLGVAHAVVFLHDLIIPDFGGLVKDCIGSRGINFRS